MKSLPKKFSLQLFLLMAVFMWTVLRPGPADGYLYTIKADVRLRSGPGLNFQTVQILDHNQTLIKLGENHGWVEAKTQSGQNGYLRRDTVSETWIKVHKKERKLYLIEGDRIKAVFKVALCPSNPLGDKVEEGDGATPEGRFFICESLRKPGRAKYGARSMRLSYPNIEDARRGLATGLINFNEYWSIVTAVRGREDAESENETGKLHPDSRRGRAKGLDPGLRGPGR